MIKKEKGIIFGIVIILIVLAIVGIFLLKGNGVTEEEAKCIAEKSVLYVSKTCGHCATQKQILGDYLKYFNIIDCIDEKDKCISAGIVGVPTWIINGKKYEGVRELNELKKLAGC